MDGHQIFFVSTESSEPKTFLSSKEFFSGWIAGIVGLFASHPLDTIKVVAQEGHGTTLSAVHRIYQRWGINGFYKGVLVPASMAGIQNAIFFGAFANTYRYLVGDKPHDPLQGVFYAGNVAGLVQVTLTTPVEVIKIRLQTAFKSKQSGILKTCRDMWMHGGPMSFYKGFIPTIIRDVPTGGLYVIIYKHLDSSLEPKIGAYWAHCVAGGFAGMLSYLPALPADLVKTRMQADDLVKPRYPSMRHCIATTLHNHGAGFFFQAALPFAVRAFFNNAALFLTYEFCLQHVF